MANLKFQGSFPNQTTSRKAKVVEVSLVSVCSSSRGVGPKTLEKLTLSVLVALKKVW